MKKMVRSVVICLSLVILGGSSNVFAFHRAGAFTFTLGGGYAYFSPKRHIDNAGIPYGAVGYDFTDRWGLEGLMGFFNTDPKRNQNNGRQISGNLFALDVVYHFVPYRFIQPYLLAGPGVIGLNPNGSNANNEGNINAAVGADLFVNPFIAFRIEARDFYTIVGGKQDIFPNAGVTFLAY